jgi:hypothetical protein
VLVARHLPTFLGQAEEGGSRPGLPGFVRREMVSLLDCGILARGFLRVRCPRCREELLVAFSCKGRGICPSCGGRRMADTAAHLVDNVLPLAPVRQWVLSLPFGLRFAVAFDRDLCRAVRSAFIDTVLAELRRRARRQGVVDGRSGAVVCVQRFGGSLNLNVHFHALVLDGVFHREAGRERPVFRAARRLSAGDLSDVLAAVRARIVGLLRRRGLLPEEEPLALEDLAQSSPTLAGMQAASIQGRRVLRVGRRPGTEFVQQNGNDCAASDGFTLHAGVCVPGGPRDRERLEHLCRYVARPAIATERLSELPDGRIAYDLRRPWSDGTHRIVFEPLAFLEKLAALVPPPRAHLVTYHGVLAPASALRSLIVPSPPKRRDGCAADAAEGSGRTGGRHPWADLLKRVFAVDVLRCPGCGGRRKIVAAITQAAVIRAILAALGLPTDPPAVHPARGPPGLFEGA